MMGARLLTLAQAAFAAFFIACAAAQAGDLDAEMRRHLDWIGANTDYDVEGVALPAVEYLGRDAMQIAYYGPEKVAKAEFEGYLLPEVMAFYDPERRTMVLRDDFDAARDGHILVHELVHHLQYLQGGIGDDHCAASLEPEAYRIQEQWQDAMDHPGPRPDKLMVLMLTMSCREQHW